MKKEIWKDVEGYEGIYKISTYGRIKSYKTRLKGKLLSGTVNSDGYNVIILFKDGERGKRIPRLVAKAFIQNPENKPQVNHKDLNKSNNHVDNLEWCTAKENTYHATRNGHTPHKLNEWKAARIRLIKEVTPEIRIAELARMFGVTWAAIYHVLKGTSYK
jgi:hypothetical protein